MTGVRLVDRYDIVEMFGAATPSTSTSQWVDLALFSHLTIIIDVINASTVTGSAITLSQAKNVSGGSSKALAFSTQFQNILAGSTDALTATVVNSNTFTTLTTNSAHALYIIEVQDTDLDLNNNFTCVQVALATGVACTITVLGILYPRYGGNVAAMPSALT